MSLFHQHNNIYNVNSIYKKWEFDKSRGGGTKIAESERENIISKNNEYIKYQKKLYNNILDMSVIVVNVLRIYNEQYTYIFVDVLCKKIWFERALGQCGFDFMCLTMVSSWEEKSF